MCGTSACGIRPTGSCLSEASRYVQYGPSSCLPLAWCPALREATTLYGRTSHICSGLSSPQLRFREYVGAPSAVRRPDITLKFRYVANVLMDAHTHVAFSQEQLFSRIV